MSQAHTKVHTRGVSDATTQLLDETQRVRSLAAMVDAAPLTDVPAPSVADDGRSEFDRATAITSRPDLAPTTGDAFAVGAFDLAVDPGWCVGPKPNGGYLLAIAARAAGATLASVDLAHPDALAATAHYLRAPDPGPAAARVEVLRPGRSASQVRVVLAQGGKPCVDVTLTMGALPTEPATWWSGHTPLQLPPIEDCPRIPARREGMPFDVSIMDRSALHMDPATLGFAQGRPGGGGELRGWISFADGRAIDPLALLYFIDAFPPATFELAASGWVPTLSLTAYIRSRPAPGPLRVSQRVVLVTDDRVDEVCEVWDSADHLVAQATQLAAIRFEPGTVAPPSLA